MAARAPSEKRPPFSGSYAPDDVTFLLKPVRLRPTGLAAKERLIQTGGLHYSEMIAPETPPDEDYLRFYRLALARNGRRLAADIAALAAFLVERARGRDELVIVSLARAGTPIGVLLHRAVARLGLAAPHYSVSIIRDRGIDRRALAHVAARHDPADAVFIDGWTGKGAIAAELHRSLADRPFGFRPYLGVVTDPAGRADLAAGEEDYLVPSGILNAVVSGLVSRSILNARLVGPDDFHACVHYREFAGQDLSRQFIEAVDALAREAPARPLVRTEAQRLQTARRCDAAIAALAGRFRVGDANRIKPGIAEATRAVLRRLPERLLVRDPDDDDIRHLLHLARRKDIEVDTLPPDSLYRAVTLIRDVRTG